MLAKLESRAVTTPVPMDQGGDTLAPGDDLWSIGFGDIDPGSNFVRPERLQDVKVSYVDNKKCQEDYSRVGGRITENMLCAAAPGKDSCQGDSVRNSSSEY